MFKVRESAASLDLRTAKPLPQTSRLHIPLTSSVATAQLIFHFQSQKNIVHNEIKCSDLILHTAASRVIADILLFLYER